MNFQDAIRICLKNYANFRGRASRSEFWWFLLAFILIAILAIAIDPSARLMAIVCLAFALPNAAVTVRRLHDCDKSAWYLLMILPPLGLVLLYLCAQPGTPGNNRFGPSPFFSPQPA